MKIYSIEDLHEMFPGEWKQYSSGLYCIGTGDYFIRQKSYCEIAYSPIENYLGFDGHFFCLFERPTGRKYTSDVSEVYKFYKKHFKMKNFQ